MCYMALVMFKHQQEHRLQFFGAKVSHWCRGVGHRPRGEREGMGKGNCVSNWEEKQELT